MKTVHIAIVGTNFNRRIADEFNRLKYGWKEIPPNVVIEGSSSFSPDFKIDVRNFREFDEEWWKKLITMMSTMPEDQVVEKGTEGSGKSA